MAKCPVCGKENEAGTNFCEDCGAKLEVQEAPAAPAQPKVKKAKKANPAAGVLAKVKAALLTAENAVAQSGIPKAWIRPGAAILSLILVLSILLSILAGAGAKTDYTMYIKDGELYYTGLSKFEPLEITDKLVDFEGVTNGQLANSTHTFAADIFMSKDGKRLFFPDKYDLKNTFTLYYCNVNKGAESAQKVDSGISSYWPSEDGKRVLYIKDGNLYLNDLKDKTKIASDVTNFYASDDCKTIIYRTTEKDLYMKKGNKDKEKIDSEVTSLSYISDDCSTILYRKEDSLYKKVGNKDKEKISSGVSYVFNIQESGELYFVTSETNNVKLSTYVNDDLKAADEALTEPVAPNRNDYSTYDEYSKARDEYYTKRDEYYAKQARDELRNTLDEETIELTDYQLHFYNGKESTKISDTYADDYYSAGKASVIAFNAYGEAEEVSIKISELEYTYQIEEKVREARRKDIVWNLACKDTVSEIDAENLYSMDISSDGKTAYFLDEVDEEKNVGELYKITISGNKIKKTEKFESDVYYSNCYFIDDDMYVYFMEVKEDGKGELYLNKDKVDEDVRRSGISYNEDSKTLAYYVDWNAEKQQGTLKAYKGGKAKVVKDDVHDYEFTADGEILYLYDYSLTNYRGELWKYSGKSKQIDNDVVAILPLW